MALKVVVVVSIFLRSIVLLFKSITAPTCSSRDTGVRGGTPGLSTTVYFTMPLTPPIPESISTFPNTLALPPMPTAWLSPRMTRGFESKLVEESLFGLSKRTNVDDSTLCSCQQVTHLATSIPVKLAASSSPLQRELISWSIFSVSKKKTTGTLRDRHCTRPPCSIRSSPSGSSTSCSFPSGSCATRHQGYAFSKRPSSCRRGSARSTHESICCHRDHSSRCRSIYHDSHTCPRK